MKAKALYDYIPVVCSESYKGVRIISVSCADHEAYISLPKAVEFDGKVLGLAGWNSDRYLAYYKSDVTLARIM